MASTSISTRSRGGRGGGRGGGGGSRGHGRGRGRGGVSRALVQEIANGQLRIVNMTNFVGEAIGLIPSGCQFHFIDVVYIGSFLLTS